MPRSSGGTSEADNDEDASCPSLGSSSDGKADHILPMILAFSAIFPGEEARQFATRSRGLLQRGDFDTAAVSLGEQFSRRLSASSLQRRQIHYKRRGWNTSFTGSRPDRRHPLREVLNGSLSQAKQNFLCCRRRLCRPFLSGGYDLSRLVDAPALDRNMPEMQVLEHLRVSEGFGEYGIVALTSENIQSLGGFSANREKNTPNSPDRSSEGATSPGGSSSGTTPWSFPSGWARTC